MQQSQYSVYDITPENAFEKHLRCLYLGGTDIAAICGLSTYKTPYEVWLEKTGQAPEETLTEEQEELFYWGHALEDPIATKWLIENPDWEILTANEFTVDPEENFLCSNTDRRVRNKVTGEIALLECKTVASSAFKHWKLGVPLGYYGQGQHYLGVGGYDRIFFALFVMDSRKLIQLEVIRDDAFIEEIRGLAVTFWNDHVITMIPPDKKVSDWTATKAIDESIIATPEIVSTVQMLKGAKAAEKQAKEVVEQYEETVKLYLQDKKVLVHPDNNNLVLVTWNGSDVTRAVGTKVIKEVAPDLFDKLTNTKYSRIMLVK